MPKIKTVKQIKQGEYIQLLRKDGTPYKKVWERGEFNQSIKKYALTDYEDFCNYKHVKGDSKCIIADI